MPPGKGKGLAFYYHLSFIFFSISIIYNKNNKKKSTYAKHQMFNTQKFITKYNTFFCNDIKLYTMDKGLKRDMLSTHTFTTICTLNDYRVSKIEATIEMQETSI